jgi:heme/copper-type cytochrome/quinol oxidase subunit 4
LEPYRKISPTHWSTAATPRAFLVESNGVKKIQIVVHLVFFLRIRSSTKKEKEIG